MARNRRGRAKILKAGVTSVSFTHKVTKRGGPSRLQPVKGGGARLPANANVTPSTGSYTGINAAAAFPKGGFSARGVKTLDFRRSTK